VLERQQSTVPADKKCALHHQTNPQAHRHHRASGVDRNTPCECPPASGRSAKEAGKITAGARTTQGEMPPHFLPATAERSAPGELIPGTSRLVHLEENMKIADVTLSDDDIAELEKSI